MEKNLCKEGPVVVIKRKKGEDRYFFLFTDCLIVTKERKKEAKFEFEETINLANGFECTDVADSEGIYLITQTKATPTTKFNSKIQCRS